MNGKDLAKLEKELIDYQGKDRVISAQEMQEEIRNCPVAEFKVNSRIGGLDNYIDGFEGGELIVVSGLPKSGKSLCLMTLTRNFEWQKQGCCWFSYEMPPRQFLRKFPELPVFYLPKQLEFANVWWMEKRMLEAKLKYGVKIFFIDHLHYLLDMSRIKSPSLEIGAILRKLKLIAINNNFIIFLVCHTGKVPTDKDPDGQSIRDSSFILSESDTSLILWRIADGKDKNGREIKNEARLRICMTRRTGCWGQVISLQKVKGWLEGLTVKEELPGKKELFEEKEDDSYDNYLA